MGALVCGFGAGLMLVVLVVALSARVVATPAPVDGEAWKRHVRELQERQRAMFREDVAEAMRTVLGGFGGDRS